MYAGDGWQEKVQAVLQSSHISQTAAEEIMSVFSSAEYEHVSYEVLLPRLEEGIAKRVSPNLIITVLERELSAYIRARIIITEVLDEETAHHVLSGITPWSRTVTLLLQGADKEELKRLLQAFSKQDMDDRWNNYRYGSSLYAALLQWGMDKEQSLDIVSAVAQSYIPANDYKGILDTLISGTRLRVSPDTMAERMIQTLPGLRSLEELHDRVLY